MPSSALQKLQGLHQELYQHALQSTLHITAMNTAEIAAYSQNFHASLPQSFFQSNMDALVKSLASAHCLLFGDFHTLQQSQRGFLHILQQVKERYPHRDLMVAMEIFSAHDQASIDGFLAGQMSEKAFLGRIDYHNKWGFPWEYYQPIVAFCAANKISIIGINTQFDTPNRLIRRDAFAADILNRWLSTHADHLCLCLIGEYHLADQHLLNYMSPLVRTIRVVNNIDDYYFKSVHLPLESTEYLQLSPNFFCMQNTVPWIKWQSLAMWEELHSNRDGGHADDSESYTEHHYDYDYQLLHILKALNQFMSLGKNHSELTLFDLYIRPDRATLDYIKAKLKMSRAEMLTLEMRAQSDGFAYSSAASTIIINDANINRFTEIAGFYLFDRLHRVMARGRLNLLERIERQICGTIAAMIMNPRRAMQWSLSSDVLNQNVKSEAAEFFGQALLYDKLITHPDIIFKNLSHWDKWDQEQSYFMSRQAGEILGLDIFRQIFYGPAHLLEENLRQAMSLPLPELLSRWLSKDIMLTAS